MNKRIVVTGLGAVSPLGLSEKETWENLKKGKSGISRIQNIDAPDLSCQVGGEIHNFDPNDFKTSKEHRKMSRFSQLFVASSAQALEDSGLDKNLYYDSSRISVIIGNGIGGFQDTAEASIALENKGIPAVPPLSIPRLIINEGAANVAMKFGIHGPSFGLVTACSSGADAIGQAFIALQAGVIDAAIVGGSEASMTKLGYACFEKLKTLSTQYNDQPEKASRPFDRDRDGFVMSEGGATLILEDLEAARKRGAKIYGEIVAYTATSDSYHLTSPLEDGSMMAKAMESAFRMANISPEQIGYINAHGTSTPINDPTETRSIKLAFKDHAKKLKISSTKSMLGHMLGATGAMEALITIKALQDQFVPPTINLDNPDPECDLDYVPHKGQDLSFDYGMSNSLGFGGHNSCLVIKRFID